MQDTRVQLPCWTLVILSPLGCHVVFAQCTPMSPSCFTPFCVTTALEIKVAAPMPDPPLLELWPLPPTARAHRPLLLQAQCTRKPLSLMHHPRLPACSGAAFSHLPIWGNPPRCSPRVWSGPCGAPLSCSLRFRGDWLKPLCP